MKDYRRKIKDVTTGKSWWEPFNEKDMKKNGMINPIDFSQAVVNDIWNANLRDYENLRVLLEVQEIKYISLYKID